VADAAGRDQRKFADFVFEVVKTAEALVEYKATIFKQRYARGIVASVLKPGQPLNQ